MNRRAKEWATAYDKIAELREEARTMNARDRVEARRAFDRDPWRPSNPHPKQEGTEPWDQLTTDPETQSQSSPRWPPISTSFTSNTSGPGSPKGKRSTSSGSTSRAPQPPTGGLLSPSLLGAAIIMSSSVPPETVLIGYLAGRKCVLIRNLEYVDPGRVFRRMREQLEAHLAETVRAAEDRLGLAHHAD
jgi:hypothetical protein